MYQYPLLLLTSDDVRNATIADLLEAEMSDWEILKKSLYSRLSDEQIKRYLYDILEIEITMTKMLLVIFRSNINVVNKELTPLEQWRIKERLKRCLYAIRTCSVNILHNHDNYAFSDSLMKLELWENSVNVVSSTTSDWNRNFVSRVGDVHKHLHRLVSVLEPVLLFSNVHLKPLDKKKGLATNYNETINSLGTILEACRKIYNEISEYTRLMDTL